MLRQRISVVLVCTLLSSFAVQARAAGEPAQTQTGQTTGLKEQVRLIPAGSWIEVRLNNKKKLRGQLGGISEEGFAVQRMKAGKMEVQNAAFSEVQAIQQEKNRDVRNGLIGVGAFIGIIGGIGVLVAVIVLHKTCSNGGCK